MSRFAQTEPGTNTQSGGQISSLDSLIRKLQVGNETSFDVANEIAEDGAKKTTFTIAARKLNPEKPEAPIKAPSDRRAHILYDIEGFISYVKKFGTTDTVVFADPNSETMVAILNEKSPDGFEAITMKPRLHPLFEPWNQLIVAGKAVKIRDFVDFLHFNRRSIVYPDGKELLFMLSQVRLSRSVEIFQGSGTNSTNGILVKTNVSGTPKDDVVDLPETITIHVPVYLQTTAKNIEIDITLGGTEAEGVFVRLSASGLIQAKTELFDTMLAAVKGGVSETVTVTTGTPNHEDWEYLGTND